MRKYGRGWKILFIPLIVLAFIGFGYVTMLLWNSLMPVIFKLPDITFWQAIGLLILFRLLFGMGHGHHGNWHNRYRSRRFREKWEKMSPEERERFGSRFGYCGYSSRSTVDSPQTTEEGK